MKITLITSDKIRHNYLIHLLSEHCTQLLVIQEKSINYESIVPDKYTYSEKLKNLYLSINIVGLFLIIQIFLGIFTLIYGAQIYLASMHQLSSIFLVSSSVYLLYLNSN